MIRRATVDDIPFLNSVANDDDVLPYVSDGRRIDFSGIPDNCISFISKSVVVVFVPIKNSVWEFHGAALPEDRGRTAAKAFREMTSEMFLKYGAKRLVTTTPDDCKHASPPKALGFKAIGRHENYTRGLGGSIWELKKEDWRHKCHFM
jgi:hypothetical protein